MKSESLIRKFYDGRNVLITGATGFVGKALIEKLLRSCPEIGKIYVIIRPKGEKDVEKRLQELLNNLLFSVVKNEHPTLLEKVIPIVGDVSAADLGLNDDDRKMLCEEVSIVFHSAAVVKFESYLRTAVNINVLGTRRVLELCKDMAHLQAMVYMSTAFSNCDKEVIDEIVYPLQTNYQEVINFVEEMKDEMLLIKLTPELIGEKPNVYTFSKAMAEQVIINEGKGLPVCIVRPSVVTGANKEPMEGWIDNLNGASGLLAAIGKGLVRTIYFKGNINANFIPIDLLTNFSLCAAWNMGQMSTNMPVYNCCIGSENVLPWAKLVEWMCKYCMRYPFSDAIWFPSIATSSSEKMTQLSQFTSQYLPAFLMDQISRLRGQEPRMLLKYAQLKKALGALNFFGNHSWHFETSNVEQLYAKLTPVDKTMFDFNVKNVKWERYIINYVLGVRRYVFNDPDESLITARCRVHRMFLIQKGIQLMVILGFWTFGLLFTGNSYSYLFFMWVLLIVWFVREIPGLISSFNY